MNHQNLMFSQFTWILNFKSGYILSVVETYLCQFTFLHYAFYSNSDFFRRIWSQNAKLLMLWEAFARGSIYQLETVFLICVPHHIYGFDSAEIINESNWRIKWKFLDQLYEMPK